MTMTDELTIARLTESGPMIVDVYPSNTNPTREEVEDDPSLLPGIVARRRILAGFESGARFQCMTCDREWQSDQPCHVPVAALAVVVNHEQFRDPDDTEWPMLIGPLRAHCIEDRPTLRDRVFAALRTIWPTLQLHGTPSSITSEAKH